MNVLYLADIRLPLERANGIQTMETCHALAGRGHRVTLLVRPDTQAPARDPLAFYGLAPDERFRIERVPVRGRAEVRRAHYLAAAIARALRMRPLDVVFTRDLGLASLLLRVPRAARPPIVYESHGYAPVVSGLLPELLSTAPPASRGKARRLAARERRVWAGAEGYVTITAALAHDLRARLGDRGAHTERDRSVAGRDDGGPAAVDAAVELRTNTGTRRRLETTVAPTDASYPDGAAAAGVDAPVDLAAHADRAVHADRTAPADAAEHANRAAPADRPRHADHAAHVDPAEHVDLAKAIGNRESPDAAFRSPVDAAALEDPAIVPDGVRLSDDRRFSWNGPSAAHPIAVYAGHLYPWKGVDTLIDALVHAPALRARIIGGHPSEPDLARLQARARAAGVADRTEFLGLQPPPAVAALLASADVLVLPNRATSVSAHYTSPLKLFEYLAAGRPIVASDLPALREVLQHGVNAWLTPPDDAAALAAGLLRVTGDAPLARALARAAFDAAAEYSWTRRAARLEPVLQAAIARGRGASANAGASRSTSASAGPARGAHQGSVERS